MSDEKRKTDDFSWWLGFLWGATFAFLVFLGIGMADHWGLI